MDAYKAYGIQYCTILHFCLLLILPPNDLKIKNTTKKHSVSSLANQLSQLNPRKLNNFEEQ